VLHLAFAISSPASGRSISQILKNPWNLDKTRARVGGSVKEVIGAALSRALFAAQAQGRFRLGPAQLLPAGGFLDVTSGDQVNHLTHGGADSWG
jgi:hypothetical protein